MRWGADPSGGAPYVFTDPANPDNYIGYEKEMVDALAAAMGRRAEFVPSDWETLVPALQRRSFDVIVNGQPAVREHANTDKVNLLGICEGGVFALCYAALYPNTVSNLVLTITPVDFHADQVENRVGHGFINLWTRSLDPENIDRLIEERAAARKAKNFKESDRIRDLLGAAGVVLEDMPGGKTLWRRG